MANDFLNINDLILINDMNLSDVEGITDLTNEAPVLARMPAVSASNGTQHKYLKETGAPNVGFRAVNTGREFDHSVDTLVSIDMKFIDASTVPMSQ